MGANLGRLEKVDLREAWVSESSDFTPWLASVENIELLGDAIGLELEVEAQEKEVGSRTSSVRTRLRGTGCSSKISSKEPITGIWGNS